MTGKTKTAAAARKFPQSVIRASAGTGKTFQLSNRFIGLLQDDAQSGDSILATTFTRKAAGEILDRVLLRLAKAALSEKDAAELAAHVGDNGLTRGRCLEVLARAARQLHRLRIGTLDSFFAQLARGFGLELGLPPGWRIIDEAEDARLRREAVAAVLREQETQNLKTLMSHLTKGETTRGVAELVHTTVRELYGIFQEVTREAWHSLPRYAGLSNEELSATLAELRDAALPKKRMQTTRDKDLELAVAGDWDAFIRSGLAAKILGGTPTYYNDEIPAGVVALYEKLFLEARSELVGKLVLQTEGTFQLLEKFDREYQRLKHERRALRFEDVTRGLADLSLLGDVGRLGFRLDANVDHLLLDEFQDTAPAQWRVLRPFAERIVAGSASRSFFCVGDVKQAIYGWRGGVAEIFDSVEKELAGLETRPLDKSFRSAQPIIDTVNLVFQGLGKHNHLDREVYGVKLWKKRFLAHTTNHAELSGYVCLETAAAPQEGKDAKDARLEYAAERIAEIEQQSPGRQIGVLLRSNEGVARLVFALRQLGVAASEEGGNPLTDSAAVQAVLSLLALADHPGDKVARFHVETTPLARLFTSHESASPPVTRLDALQISVAVRRELLDFGYGPTIRRYADALVPSCNRRELARLVQLVELAYGYDARATLRTADFLEYVRSQRVPDPTGANVRVMTVHQAKGLEFEIVVLPQLEGRLIGQSESFVVHRPDPAGPVERVCRYVNKDVRQLLPKDVQAMFDAADDRDVTESLCVLYVALTRAARALYMIVPASAGNERTLPKTFAGILRAALHGTAPAPEKTKLLELGDPKWFKEDAQAAAAVGAETPIEPITIRVAPPLAGSARGLERVSPSGLEGGPKVRLSAVFAPREGRLGMEYGTLIHALFEQIRWLEDGVPSDDALRAAIDRSLDPSLVAGIGFTKTLAEFRSMLQKPEIARALSRGYYAAPRLEVQAERGFALRYEANKLLQGSIDRLVLLYSGEQLQAADILDYKTDAIPPGAAAKLREKVEYYSPQLHAYRAAVAQMYRLPDNCVTARLLFVGAGIVAQVS